MASDSTGYTWSPPICDLTTPPELRQTYAIKDEGNHVNFARNARWTPDGSVFLAHCEDQTLQLFGTTPTTPPNAEPRQPTYPPPFDPSELIQAWSHVILLFNDDLVLPSPVLRQSAPILDFTWFPSASPHDPASFCFLASVRECPVKLLDASDGRLRASYKIVDHRERFVAPHSMTFNLDATKIYCGYEDAIEVFDVLQPGEGTRIATTPSRKSKDGLKGIVSALAFSPNYSTESDAFFAAGTLNTTLANLALYNESQSDAPLMFIGGGDRAGVTQLRFNPMNPHILYAAHRRRDAILAWDLRSDVNLPLAKYVLPHKPMTNQKMIFDVDATGQRLAVGGQQGNVYIFDLTKTKDDKDDSDTELRQPDLVVDAHSDSVGSVAFHPYQPILLSTSGSRHFNDSDIESDSSEDSGTDEDETPPITSQPKTRPVCKDSSIKTWSFQTIQETTITTGQGNYPRLKTLSFYINA
ncbi:Telomerase Cajal body protein 1 [Leucoagaricus sp. SymC.cos]|nr:Telomerase Cajal body protein 1 [Leucoagaricus sp. SymC.cos]